jgi:peptidoglycan hydrolase-like protein with peptidoglycan-binding domain
MITIANSFAAKLTVAFVAIAMMFSLVAAPAQAQTAEELQAQIDTLMATITALQAELGVDGADDIMSSSSVCPYTWTRSLNMGDTGSDVMMLQQFLNADAATQVAVSGAGSVGAETEYYGPATGAAVAKFQEMYRAEILSPLDLVNSTTFFGNSTRAQANALCVAAPVVVEVEEGEEAAEEEEAEAGSDSLGNDEGSIESISEVSADEGDLEEGQTGGVLAFDIEIEGDLEINRMDFFAEQTGAATENDADEYFEGASLWVDGDKVADLDVSDFDDDDAPYSNGSISEDYDYRLRFSGLDLVFSDDAEPEFQLVFEVRSSLDSDSVVNGGWDVELASIRSVDGAGFTDSMDADDSVEETFTFDAEETAELDISESSDNPDAATLKIDEGDDESDEYTVFVFEIEEENGVDVTIDDMTFTILTTGSTTEADVVDEVILYQGSTELSSESGATTVTFENLGIAIDADSTEEFSIAMIFKGVEDHGLVSDVKVTLTSIDDAEDANGNDEGEMTIDGETTTASEVHTLRTVVPTISDTSFSVDKAEDDKSGTISFEFTIGAEDDDYNFGVASKPAVDGTSDDIRFTTSGASSTLGVAAITLISGDASVTGAGWTIADGDEATFVVDMTFTTDSSADNGTYRVNVATVGGIEVDDTSDGMSIAF